MKTVVDASIVLDLLLGEGNKKAEIFWQSQASERELVAPTILAYEVMNGLRSAVLRQRMNLENAGEGWSKFEELKIRLVGLDNGREVVEFAVRNMRSVYDASYVVLSQELNCELVTLDKNLEELV